MFAEPSVKKIELVSYFADRLFFFWTKTKGMPDSVA